LINYFSKYICPDRFSLSSDETKKYNFFEVHIFVPKGKIKELANIPSKNRGALRINFEFMPSKNSARWGGILAGRMKRRLDPEFSDCLMSIDHLRYARIDVNYYFKGWDVREQKCSLYMLIKLFLLRATGAIYLSILKHKIFTYFRKVTVFRRLRTPLRSKFEIYEALMNNDDFLQRGTFRKSELSKSLFGNHYVGEFKVYQKVSQSLDWILESCVEDGEVQKISHQNEHDPLYKVKGKGIHYFTLTKESIKNNESANIIQKQQVAIQRRMAWLTFLLVIGTFLTTIDKWGKAKELFISIVEPIFPYIEMVRSTFI
jgi:hypothetical protein